MHPAYAAALETRLRWLEWAKRGPGPNATWQDRGYHAEAMPMFVGMLEEGETFYMDEHFCGLVQHAMPRVPDTLAFELDWMVRPAGWLYLATPFTVPLPTAILDEGSEKFSPVGERPALVGAIGWRYVPAGTRVRTGLHGPWAALPEPGTHFTCFLDCARMLGARPTNEFGAWSFFVLRDGQPLGERIRQFEAGIAKEDPGGRYRETRSHELRWIYTAMHLMAQRLSVRVRHETNRAERRRLDRPLRPAPPFITVVTLRRLEAARPKGPSAPRDWHWQWEVRGHWRNQWYAKEGIHKPVFVDAYVKGPAGKPFKEAGTKLFVARR